MGRSQSKKGAWRISTIITILLLVLVVGLVTAQGLTEDIIDADGPNDYPGQKDLTRLYMDYTNYLAGSVDINWNWDESTLSGANTGDACALFDTDDDGFANHAVCVTWDNGQTLVGYLVYTCDDTAALNCNVTSTLADPVTTCDVSLANDDPFPAGDDYPNDAKASCTIELDEVGGTSAELIDVCSYPSSSLPSVASDCVTYSLKIGNLEVIKDVVPDDPTTNWDITVTGTSGFTDTLMGDDSTGNRAVEGGLYTITETAGIDTDLGFYSTSWVCTESGTQATISGTGTSITDLDIDNGDIWACTFTNEAAVDVTVTKTDYDYARPTYGYPIYPYPGSLLPYSITVTNKDMPGDVPAQGVVVTDTLDANVFYDGTVPFTISSPADNDGLPRSCSHVGGVVTCNLGSMAPDEVVTIDFAVRVGAAPTFFLIETGECIQSTPYNLQGTTPVDVCNIVSVTATNELEPYTVDNSDSEPTDLGVPTAVDINIFTATGEAGAIRLDWATETEIDNLGFYLYRARSLHAPRTKINDEIIPGTPGGMGATYSYVDEVNSRNVFYYWIESVDINNYAEFHEDFASARALKKIK